MEDEASPQEHDSPGSWRDNEKVGAILDALAYCYLLLSNGTSPEERNEISSIRVMLRERLYAIAPEARTVDYGLEVTARGRRLRLEGKDLWQRRLDRVVEELSPAATAMMS